MPISLLATAGPLTGFLGELATTIGSGLVVGGFVGGLSGIRRSVEDSERKALLGSHAGGTLALLGFEIDIVRKHFV